MTRRKHSDPTPPTPPLEDADTVLAELSDDEAVPTHNETALAWVEENQDEFMAGLQAIAGNYCPNCKQKILTDLFNVPICPIALPDCPRNITP